MYKLKYIILGLLLTSSCNLLAQKIAIYKGGLTLSMSPATIRDSIIIDTTQMSLKYRFSYSPQRKDSVRWGNILLQIGTEVVKQQDLVLYYSHMIDTKKETKGVLSGKVDTQGNSVTNIFSEIYCNRQTGIMTIVCGDFFDRNKMKDYLQQMPDIKWQLQTGEKQVCGYKCYHAIATYGGREWSVWYTTEIPYTYGPWKLNGLPGMILYATDKNNFTFECIEIIQRVSPIVSYHYSSIQHLKNLETYLRYEYNCYEHPYETFSQGGEALLYVSGPDGKAKAIDTSYKVPYVPIEQELSEK